MVQFWLILVGFLWDLVSSGAVLERSGKLWCSFGVVWGVHVGSGESWWVLVGSGEFWVQFWCVLVWFLWALVSSGGFW